MDDGTQSPLPPPPFPPTPPLSHAEREEWGFAGRWGRGAVPWEEGQTVGGHHPPSPFNSPEHWVAVNVYTGATPDSVQLDLSPLNGAPHLTNCS